MLPKRVVDNRKRFYESIGRAESHLHDLFLFIQGGIKMIAVLKPVYDKYSKTLGQDLVDRLMAEIKKQ